ncbi:NUDIX domain-containing protein [Arcobacter cryaerophilus gv. pseudocryaerophilus]|uniref:NUDIX domain-containing protein n=4 Tax=unclassified Arcobacter TaxID=2593671 RepID=A0AA96L7R3_9BACT|nr:NUDIX domain-containing protein [Arcobacter sp. AZ-2023]WNP37562.1 NUDIX domain-containing protein [Arcobacter sp. AZ-2023]WNP39654.1 NUDIX domain-containing protein [Arcobacter sp. AZ-2023]WPD05054.1 NUDIX domain-containing protein [Arcobacter sp. DSM 115956]WPD07147.1 NUDIX domain-containing protein [Arcobacter sp. DSM 115955]
MMRVVVGIITDNEEILLLKKNNPDWQKGLYNGIGGKVELNTTPLETIIKKCQEELGANISNWIELDSEISSSGIEIVYFLTTLNEGEIKKLQSQTDERAELFYINNLPTNILQDLKIQIERQFFKPKNKMNRKTKLLIYVLTPIFIILLSLMIVGKIKTGSFLYYLTDKKEDIDKDKSVEFIKGFKSKLFGD